MAGYSLYGDFNCCTADYRRLADMHGRKHFYTAGITIFILGSLLCGLSQTMTHIIIFRGFQGIGAGIMMANAFTVIGDLFPPAERGKYFGLITAVFGISCVIGPTLGGFITDSFSWHWIFYISEFVTKLPETIKAIIPPELLSSVTRNAQMLVGKPRRAGSVEGSVQ